MLDEERVLPREDYYKALVKEGLSHYPTTFVDFVKEEKAILEGDRILSTGISTGYNFANDVDFPLGSENLVIIYNNYIQRTSHFAKVLALMESGSLIDGSEISFGAKATKVLGKWKDEELVIFHLETAGGKLVQTSESVEGCLVFYPKGFKQVINLITFLEVKARKREDIPFIEGSWTIPDIRTSRQLEELALTGLSPAYAHKFTFNFGNLITLKKNGEVFEEGWFSQRILINDALFEFIS